ncbi:hypothetical protein KR044_001268 [Drosophila immigrans]|nr:hypothetical protein KR044_001268 [Drosophila immigrans]
MVMSEYAEFSALERSLRWMRGMSIKQINGCNKLLHALRDDIEQESTYRVRECLTLLGLNPLLTAEQIKATMSLSQESDLAFLWFIWEGFYKTSQELSEARDDYSINEQLILSGIAHLDMKTTLRALDQILPTSEHSKKYHEMQRAAALNEAKKKRLRREDATVYENTSPYMMPQVRPKPFVPLSMMATPKDRQLVCPRYDTSKNELYPIPNESRWFASYELSPVKRIVKHCLADALAPLFSGKPLQRSVCNVHRMLEFAATRKQQELAVEVTKRCLNALAGKKDELRRRCVVRQLERDVQQATQKMRREARQQLAQLQRLIGGPCSDEPVRIIQLGPEKLLRLIKPDTVRSLRNTYGSHAHCGQGLKYKSNVRCPPTEGLIKVLDSKGELKKAILPRLDLDRCLPEARESDASEDKFCSRRTMESGVLQWDYFKIYKPAEPAQPQTQVQAREQAAEQLDASAIIRSYCIAALKEAMDTTRDSIKSAIESPGKELERGTSRLSAGLEHGSASESSARSCFKTAADRIKHVQTIDPDDKEMLIKLLKIAIDILQKDPQYVLATLPNAHMIPELVEWVGARYGKTYGYREMESMAKSMRAINHHLNVDSFSQNVPFPNSEFMRKYKSRMSYDKRKEFICQVRQMEREYYKKLNKASMDESRLIWLAMHGYSNLAGSVTDTYFAYLPAKESDFMRHHLWSPQNYRDLVSLRRIGKAK